MTKSQRELRRIFALIRWRVEDLTRTIITCRDWSPAAMRPAARPTAYRVRLAAVLAAFALLSMLAARHAPAAHAAKDDFVIVALGDSYISGEGNPDVPAHTAMVDRAPDPNAPSAQLRQIPTLVPAEFDSEECHRSKKAWAFRAAQELAANLKSRKVVFHSEACSGATFDRGGATYDVHTQIKRLATWLKQPTNDLDGKHVDRVDHIDAILMSVGGDDVYFKDIVKGCIVAGLENLGEQVAKGAVPLLASAVAPESTELILPLTEVAAENLPTFSCSTNTSLVDEVKPALDGLSNEYVNIEAEIAGDILPSVPIGNVLATEYPDLTQDSDGATCDHKPWTDELGLVSKSDASWAADLGKQLNSQVSLGVVLAGSAPRLNRTQIPPKWQLIDTIAAQFSRHGYCVDAPNSAGKERYFNTIGDSQTLLLGHLNLDLLHADVGSEGALHPNEDGQVAYQSQVYPKLAALAGLAEQGPTPTNTGYGTLATKQLDLALVVDSTSSMAPYIDAVKASANEIVDKIATGVPKYRFAVVDFKDYPNGGGDSSDYPFRIDLPFTDDRAAIIRAIDAIATGGGGDPPEAAYSATIATMQDAATGGWRVGAVKHVIVFSDAPPHDPEPTTKYTADDVVRIAEALDPAVIDVVVPGGNAEAETVLGQLATRTGGKLYTPADASQVADAVLSAVTTITDSVVASPPSGSGSIDTTATSTAGGSDAAPAAIGISLAFLAFGAVAFAMARRRRAAAPAASASRLLLVGPGGVRIPLRSGRQMLGREPDCDIVLQDAQVSRRHALLTVDARGAVVDDLSSSFGVFVNGTRISRCAVLPGDRVTFGSTQLTLAEQDVR